MSNISQNFGWQIPRNSLVTSRLGSDSSAMSNSPAFFLPFCLLELFSSTNADVGSMIDKAVSSSQDKTQENISRLWTLHESHFWLWRCGRQANTDVIYQRRRKQQHTWAFGTVLIFQKHSKKIKCYVRQPVIFETLMFMLVKSILRNLYAGWFIFLSIFCMGYLGSTFVK